MSKWEQRGVIDAEYRAAEDGGELMLSASDVIAYLRHYGCCTGVAIADHLAGMCFDATRTRFIDTDGSDT